MGNNTWSCTSHSPPRARSSPLSGCWTSWTRALAPSSSTMVSRNILGIGCFLCLYLTCYLLVCTLAHCIVYANVISAETEQLLFNRYIVGQKQSCHFHMNTFSCCASAKHYYSNFDEIRLYFKARTKAIPYVLFLTFLLHGGQ